MPSGVVAAGVVAAGVVAVAVAAGVVAAGVVAAGVVAAGVVSVIGVVSGAVAAGVVAAAVESVVELVADEDFEDFDELAPELVLALELAEAAMALTPAVGDDERGRPSGVGGTCRRCCRTPSDAGGQGQDEPPGRGESSQRVGAARQHSYGASGAVVSGSMRLPQYGQSTRSRCDI